MKLKDMSTKEFVERTSPCPQWADWLERYKTVGAAWRALARNRSPDEIGDALAYPINEAWRLGIDLAPLKGLGPVQLCRAECGGCYANAVLSEAPPFSAEELAKILLNAEVRDGAA
jgi:hypothetical protein